MSLIGSLGLITRTPGSDIHFALGVTLREEVLNRFGETCEQTLSSHGDIGVAMEKHDGSMIYGV